MATLAQRILAAATLMRSGQGGGSTNQGLTCLVGDPADLVRVHDPVSSQLVGATAGNWTEYAGTTCCAAYGLPDIP